jgi:hypothetical protein
MDTDIRRTIVCTSINAKSFDRIAKLDTTTTTHPGSRQIPAATVIQNTPESSRTIRAGQKQTIQPTAIITVRSIAC